MPKEVSVFWFRRDLRLADNHGLFRALTSSENVLPIFIFDTEILSKLENKEDKRVDFIAQTLEILNQYLAKSGKAIQIFHGKPLDIFQELTENFSLKTVFCNEDYEPSAIQRDRAINDFLSKKNIQFQSFKDQVLFHKDDILKADATPYTIYTPYSKQWLAKFNTEKVEFYPSEKLLHHFIGAEKPIFSLEKIGFRKTNFQFKTPIIDRDILKTYHETRNFPTTPTSEMSVHLRFGTISIRKLVVEASVLNETYLKELIWREFFMQILFHFPKVVHESFKRKYDQILWLYDEDFLQKWLMKNVKQI